jgi:hypothetical protein
VPVAAREYFRDLILCVLSETNPLPSKAFFSNLLPRYTVPTRHLVDIGASAEKEVIQ